MMIGGNFHTTLRYLILPPAGHSWKSVLSIWPFPPHMSTGSPCVHPFTRLHLINLNILALFCTVITHLVQESDGDASVGPTVHVSHQVSWPCVIPAGQARASVSAAYLQKQS